METLISDIKKIMNSNLDEDTKDDFLHRLVRDYTREVLAEEQAKRFQSSVNALMNNLKNQFS